MEISGFFCGIFVFRSFVGNAGISCNFTDYLLPILKKRITPHAILASVAAVYQEKQRPTKKLMEKVRICDIKVEMKGTTNILKYK